MGDKIILKGLELFGRHGVYPEEKSLGQKFYIDLELTCPLHQAGSTDDLSFGIDYSEVYTIVKRIVEGCSFNLIEALAEKIASEILEGFPVEKVKVRVKKPQAPIPGTFDFFGVEIKRRR